MRKNKVQGSNWERRSIDLLSQVLGLIKFNNKNFNEAEIGSTRQFSRHLDAEGIDVWFKHITDLHIQCKKCISNGVSTKSIDISSLDRILFKTGIRAVLFRTTKKPVNAKKETLTGEYAVLPMEDFLKLIKIWNDERLSKN